MSPVPNITLNTGIEMPMLGLGVYLAPADRTVSVVSDALSPGYRLIDGRTTSAVKRTQANVSDRGTTLVEYRHG